MNLRKLFGVAIAFVSINIFESHGESLLEHACTRVPWHHDTLSDGMRANDALNNLDALGTEIIAHNGAMPIDLTQYRSLWNSLPGRNRNYISAAVLLSKIYSDTLQGAQFCRGFCLEGYLGSTLEHYGMTVESRDLHDMTAYLSSADAAGWFKAKIHGAQPSLPPPPQFGPTRLSSRPAPPVQRLRIDPWPADSSIVLCKAAGGLRFNYGQFKPDRDDTVLIALTDLHNCTGSYGDIVAKVQSLNRKCPQNQKILVINGDFIDADYGSGCTATQKRDYFTVQTKPFLRFLAALTAGGNTKVVLNMGNHDLSPGAIEILPSILSQAESNGIHVHLINCNFSWERSSLAGSVKPFVKIGNVVVIGYCPSSTLYGHFPKEDPPSIQCLKQTLLKMAPTYDSIILAAHMEASATSGFAHSLPRFSHFHTILCGHAHKEAGVIARDPRLPTLLTAPSFGKGIGVMIIRPDGTNGKMRFW